MEYSLSDQHLTEHFITDLSFSVLFSMVLMRHVDMFWTLTNSIWRLPGANRGSESVYYPPLIPCCEAKLWIFWFTVWCYRQGIQSLISCSLLHTPTWGMVGLGPGCRALLGLMGVLQEVYNLLKRVSSTGFPPSVDAAVSDDRPNRWQLWLSTSTQVKPTLVPAFYCCLNSTGRSIETTLVHVEFLLWLFNVTLLPLSLEDLVVLALLTGAAWDQSEQIPRIN